MEQKGNNVIHHFTIRSAVLYHSLNDRKNGTLHICLSSFCIIISDEEDFDLPSLLWIPKLYYSTYTSWKIPRHVHAAIYFDDSMWTC
jgi:hypothetical protein